MLLWAEEFFIFSCAGSVFSNVQYINNVTLSAGGAADKGGILKVGDELVSVNTVDVTSMARIEAWNFLKKLPDGTVSLVLRQKVEEPQLKSEE